jgi:hypothetical protein
MPETICISYDMRTGESPAGDGQFTMESFVDDLEGILKSLNSIDRSCVDYQWEAISLCEL